MKTNETNIDLTEFIRELSSRFPKFESNMNNLQQSFIKPKTYTEWLELFVQWNNS